MNVPRRRQKRASLLENTDRRIVEYAYAGVGKEILAYLHYTVICKLPVEFFQGSVVFHCRERLQRIVSLKEVEEKLKYLWEHFHALTSGNKGWKELLHLGIDALPQLGEDKIAWVKARARDLKESVDKEKTPRLLRSALQSPSPLRVGSKRKFGTPNAPARSKTPRSEIGRPLSKVNCQKSTHAVYANLVLTKQPSFILTVPLSTDRQRQPKTHRGTRAELEGDSDLDSEPGGQSDPLTSGSQRYPSIATQVTSTFEDVPLDRACAHHKNCQKCARTHSLEHDTKAEARTARLLSELEATKSRVSQLDIELDELKLRDAETMRRRKSLCSDYVELLRRNKHLQAAVAAKGYQDIVNHHATLRVENDRLHDRVATLRASLQFIPVNWRVLENQSIGEVLRDMGELGSTLKKLMQGLDVMFSMPKNDIYEQSPLATLSRRGLSLSVVATGESWTDTLQLSRFKLREILISLVSAALCLWVFDANVEVLFTNNSPAYAKLTTLLAGHGKRCLARD